MQSRQTLIEVYLLVVAVVISALPVQSAEPKYQGRSLSKWLSTYRDAGTDTPGEKRAAEAVRAIGTNGIPVLLRMLTNDDLQVQMDAKSGFCILGAMAASAVPALAKLLASTNAVHLFMGAQVLGEIGAPALPALMEAMTNRHYKVATQAYLAIGALGTNAQPAIPLLLRDLQHPNHFNRERAADALGSLHLDPETVVPALTKLLSDISPAARSIALNSLGQFGPAAKSAVPDITPFLTNSDFDSAAKEALRAIAP